MVKVLPTPFLFLKYKFSACLPHILKTEIFFFSQFLLACQLSSSFPVQSYLFIPDEYQTHHEARPAS